MKDRKSWKLFIICLMVIAILSVPMIVHADEITVHKQVETISFFQVMRCVAELLLVILTLTLMCKVKAKNDENKGLREELSTKEASYNDELVRKLREKERICRDLENEVYELKKWKRYAIKADPDINKKIVDLEEAFVNYDVNICRERYG